MENIFYGVKDVMKMLGVSASKGYEIIRMLNEELKEENFLVLRGKVPKAYLEKRLYKN